MAFIDWLRDRASKRLKADKRGAGVDKSKDSSEPIYQVSSRSSSPASAADSVIPSDAYPSNDEDSSRISRSEDSSDDTQVVKGTVRLVPACWRYHGFAKGKGRAKGPPNSRIPAYRCGSLPLCKESVIMPIVEPRKTEAPRPYRLTTANPEEDLKRWLMTPNDTIRGEHEERDIELLQNPRYTSDMLLSTLELAIDEVRAENAHIDSLLGYLRREPYGKHPHWNDGPNPEFCSMNASNFAAAKRAELEQVLTGAAEELDFLRERISKLCKKIRRYKELKATGGDWAEIGDLLRLGFVDEEWVQEKCRV